MTTLSRPVRVLGIGGSTRSSSRSLVALNVALAAAERDGANIELADLHALQLPMLNGDLGWAGYPASVHDFIAMTRRADAYIICSPTYHGTLSGAVKNALDLLDLMADGADGLPPRTLDMAPVGLIAAGGGAGNVITPLYHTIRALGGVVAPMVVSVPNAVIHADTGAISDEAVAKRLHTMASQVVELSKRLR